DGVTVGALLERGRDEDADGHVLAVEQGGGAAQLVEGVADEVLGPGAGPAAARHLHGQAAHHEPPGHGGDVLVPQRPVDVEGGVGAEHGDRGGQLVEGLATALVGGTPVVHRGEVAREVPDPGPGVALGGGGDEVDVDDHAGGHLGAEAATRPVGAGQRRHRGGHAVVGQDGGDGDEVDAG